MHPVESRIYAVNDGSVQHIQRSGITVTKKSSHVNWAWNVSCPIGGTVVTNFSKFNTETNADWLDLFDGTSDKAKRLIHASGVRLPPPTRTSGRHMYVRYTTNYYNTFGSGLAAKFYCVESPRCMGCPLLANTSAAGASNVSQCKCRSGSFLYADKVPWAVQCKRCPAPSVSTPGATSFAGCRCRAGHYMETGACFPHSKRRLA